MKFSDEDRELGLGVYFIMFILVPRVLWLSTTKRTRILSIHKNIKRLLEIAPVSLQDFSLVRYPKINKPLTQLPVLLSTTYLLYGTYRYWHHVKAYVILLTIAKERVIVVLVSKE